MNSQGYMDTLLASNNKPKSYIANRKLVTISSDDRDMAKYPSPAEFSVNLPQPLTNVYTARLVDSNFPLYLPNMSIAERNVKFRFSVIGKDSGSPEYSHLTIDNSFNVTITDGLYTADKLAIEIASHMNNLLTEYISQYTSDEYTYFVCAYNETENRFYFGNKRDDFALWFAVEQTYVTNTPSIWYNRTFWGLPYVLGFDKTNISSALLSTKPYGFTHQTTKWLTPYQSNKSVYYVGATLQMNLPAVRYVYMELTNFNHADKTVPNQTNTSAAYNNGAHTNANAYFARIPLTISVNGNTSAHSDTNVNNMKICISPEQRIDRLNFRFRWHDGRLVDFCGQAFTFTIEFVNLLEDMIVYPYVRIPPIYRT